MQSFLAQKRLFTAVLGSEKVANPVFKAVENRLSTTSPVAGLDSSEKYYIESITYGKVSINFKYKKRPDKIVTYLSVGL